MRGGLRLRPRVRATLEVESGTNDPFAVFLTLLLVEFLLVGDQSWSHALVTFLRDTVLGCIIGVAGGRIITLVLNRLALAARPARAVRGGERAWSSSPPPMRCIRPVSSRSILPGLSSATGRRARTIPSSCFSTP